MNPQPSHGPLTPWPMTFDRHAILELSGAFVGMAVLFGLLIADLVETFATSEHLTGTDLLIGLPCGAVLAAALSAVIVRTWRRGGGRPAQRAGLHAWKTGQIPDSPSERVIVARDLKRRALVLESVTSTVVLMAALYTVVAVLQIFIAHDPAIAVAWIATAALLVLRAITDVRRRRRLPQLQALLARVEASDTADTHPA